MFGWLKRKAAQQSLFNVEINTRTLIAVSNRADAFIEGAGTTSPAYIEKVKKAQRALLTDIQLALANGATIDEVQSRIEEAKRKEAPTEGGEMAIEHVLTYVRQ